MHILLVEDDAPTAEYAANGLTQAGHVVDVLENGKEALIQVADLHCGRVLLSDNNPGLCVHVTFDVDCPLES